MGILPMLACGLGILPMRFGCRFHGQDARATRGILPMFRFFHALEARATLFDNRHNVRGTSYPLPIFQSGGGGIGQCVLHRVN